MTDATFAGNPSEIKQTGYKISGVGNDAKGDVSSRQTSLTVPGGTNGPWIPSAKATAVTMGWQSYLAGLAGRVSAYGSDLVTAATDY
jgi:hypothetical protein